MVTVVVLLPQCVSFVCVCLLVCVCCWCVCVLLCVAVCVCVLFFHYLELFRSSTYVGQECLSAGIYCTSAAFTICYLPLLIVSEGTEGDWVPGGHTHTHTHSHTHTLRR